MKHPLIWNKSDLYQHLQHALNLELWTIPLYLTALYSIKDLKNLEHKKYPEAAKLILSVVVQEMLHMELVCNVSNALGHSPMFEYPNYDVKKGMPFIHPLRVNLPDDLYGYTVKLQQLNEHSLRLFCAIELPHSKKEIDWENEKSYSSIADLYDALKTGITNLWDACYIGDPSNTKQKDSFKAFHNTGGRNHGFSQKVYSVETALKAIDAIIEQGEGADSKQVPTDFRPNRPQKGKEFETIRYKGNLSHYQKFRILLHSHHTLPLVYDGNSGEINKSTQVNMQKMFSDILLELQINFNSDTEDMTPAFWNKMYELGAAITAVWESGSCPDFNISESPALQK